MGTDKARIVVGDRSLLDHMAARLAGIADPVVIASGRRGRLSSDYREVEDAAEGAGPLAGIVGALRATTTPLLAVVAVDMPFANPDVLALLAELCAGHDAAVPVTERGLEPLHAVYARTALPELEACLAAGRLAVHEALSELDVRRVEEPEWRPADPDGRFATNLNAPEDLRLLS